MIMMTRFLMASLAALALTPNVTHASCARAEFVPSLLTTRDTHLPDDGGVLVGFAYSTDDKMREETGPDPSDVKWSGMDGKKPVALTRVALAPGLSMYKPAAGTTSFAVWSKRGSKLGTFTVDGKAPNKLTAPEPKLVKVTATASFRSRTSVATLTLVKAPPAEAIAVIVYSVDASGTTALTFTGLPDTHDKLTSFEVSRTGGHCSNEVHGTSSVEAGGKIAFAWVDIFGRVSPTSKPIVAK